MVVAAIAVVATLVGVTLSACGSSTTRSSTTRWVDQPVTFRAADMTIYATYRHPADRRGSVPAALLIAGSGPTDRDGNSTGISPAMATATGGAQFDTLKTVADWLSADGVASLRYDKLTSGQTGLGPYRADPASIGVGVFETEAAAALTYLSRRPGVDGNQLSVFGHSEGALYALQLATGTAGPVPPIHALGLIEPASRRLLDTITTQLDTQLAAAEKQGQLAAADLARLESTLDSAVQSLRTTGTLPPNLPSLLVNAGFSPTNARYLSEVDRLDPAQLASTVPAKTSVLVSCSDADIQITCADVDHLLTGLTKAHAATDIVHLHGVDHVLKQDPSRTAAHYGQPLPFSAELRQALAAFTARH